MNGSRAAILLGLCSAAMALLPPRGLAAEWTAIRCPAVDRRASARFEVVRDIDDFEKGLRAWQAYNGVQQTLSTVHLDEGQAQSGGKSLRVNYEFTGKDYDYVQFGTDVEIREPALGIGFWVRQASRRLGMKVRLRDRSGETHQIAVFQDPGEGWQFAAAMPGSRSIAWGGDGNQRLDYPIRFHSIVADRPRGGYRGKGQMWIDNVTLVKAVKRDRELKVEVLDRRLGNVYEPGETIRLRASGPGDAVRWTARDFGESVIANGTGEAAGTDVTFPMAKQGYYECRLELLVGDRVADVRTFRSAALPKPDPQVRNRFVGMCTHFRYSAYPLECMDLLVRYGITEIRDEISWHSTEPKKDTLALPEYGDALTKRAVELGVRPLLIFDYGNPAYDGGGFPNSDDAIAGYARYCAALARLLKGRVDTFEVWNEWSIGCGMRGKPGKNTPEPYARMLQAAHAAVKAAVPEATIVGIGGEHSEHHFDNIQRMITAGGAKAMDAFSVHSYRYPASPEETDLAGEITRVADMAKRHGAPARVWVTEIGWPTHDDSRGVDERVQARYLVRTMALLQSTGVVEKVHWYDFKDDGPLRDYNEHNFGVVRHQAFNYAPKAAVVAASVFARLTAGAKSARLWRGGDAWAVHYVLADGSGLVVAWSAGAESVLEVDGRELSVHDLMGNSVPALARLTLTATPVYLLGRQIQLRLAGRTD